MSLWDRGLTSRVVSVVGAFLWALRQGGREERELMERRQSFSADPGVSTLTGIERMFLSTPEFFLFLQKLACSRTIVFVELYIPGW